jgi:hypothetical protein
MPGPYGWFADITDADDYFLNERLETEAWDDLDSLASAGAYKIKALMHAYNRLFYSPNWSLPDYAHATAAQLIILTKAQAEMAYYLGVHVLYGDEDRRKGIQAQGVIRAGIVQEDYLESMMDAVPIPPPVQDLLEPWSTSKPIALFNIDRRESMDATQKIPKNFDPFDIFDFNEDDY